MPPTDPELLRRYADEKRDDAFAQLVTRRIGLVYTAALRQVGGDAHRAQDIAQEVFIALAGKARSLVRHPSIIGWLYTTTHHVAVNAIRAEQRRKRREEEAHTMHEFGSHESADWQRVQSVLDAAMHELGERERRIILLRFFDRQPFAAIGAELGLTENAAQKGADRALEKLQGLLARRGVTSTASALATVLTAQGIAGVPAGLASTIASGALTVAAGSAMSFLEFIGSTKFVVAGSAILGCLALGLAGLRVREERAAVAAVTRASQETETLGGQRRALEARAVDAEQELARLTGVFENERRVLIASNQANAAADRAARIAAGNDLLSRHPEIPRISQSYGRIKVKFQFAPLFQSLGLSQGQIDRIAELWPDGTVEGLQVNGRSVLLDMPSTPSPDERHAQIRALIGDEPYAQLMTYRDTVLPARTLAAQLASSLALSDTPLTPEQAQQLVQLGATSIIRPTYGRRSTFDWDALVPKSSAVLSPPQMAALARLHAAGQESLRP